MKFVIQPHRFEVPSDLELFIEEKLKKLEKFSESIIKIDIFLKLDNIIHTQKDKIVQMKVCVAGKEFFKKETTKSFKESFALVLNSIVKQISSKKAKLRTIKAKRRYAKKAA